MALTPALANLLMDLTTEELDVRIRTLEPDQQATFVNELYEYGTNIKEATAEKVETNRARLHEWIVEFGLRIPQEVKADCKKAYDAAAVRRGRLLTVQNRITNLGGDLAKHPYFCPDEKTTKVMISMAILLSKAPSQAAAINLSSERPWSVSQHRAPRRTTLSRKIMR